MLFVSLLLLFNQGENTSIVKINGTDYILYEYSRVGIYDFVVPQNVNRITVKMWGSGANGIYGGAGGYTEGDIIVNSNEEFKVQVGGPTIFIASNLSHIKPSGERSSVYRNNNPTDEILVAGGGGGGSASNYGGAGGGVSGQSSITVFTSKPEMCSNCYAYSSGGGNQTHGGDPGKATAASNLYYSIGVSGSRNYASVGYSNPDKFQGSPGGGGYYGGGSGASTYGTYGGGGGGSGFVAPSVLNGYTLSGSYQNPANMNDEMRNNYGSPNNGGLVLILIQVRDFTMGNHRQQNMLLITYFLLNFVF